MFSMYESKIEEINKLRVEQVPKNRKLYFVEAVKVPNSANVLMKTENGKLYAAAVRKAAAIAFLHEDHMRAFLKIGAISRAAFDEYVRLGAERNEQWVKERAASDMVNAAKTLGIQLTKSQQKKLDGMLK